ncbi:MAG: rRNA adenine dimethyltransferase family protein [Acidobacteriota bacterium]
MGRPKRRRLGQNFLVDRNIAEKIAAGLSDEPTRVLEVGPGRGALTEPLLDRFDRVLALELDKDLVPPLIQRFGGRGLEVRHSDALGLLALERAAWADARILFDVQPEAFRPRPKVVSTVVALDLKRPECEPEILDRALGLASTALTLARKKLRNALPPSVDAATIEAAGLDPAARPGTLSLQDWLRLAEHQPIEA